MTVVVGVLYCPNYIVGINDGAKVFLLVDDNKFKMARNSGKEQKENPVGCTGEGKRLKGLWVKT